MKAENAKKGNKMKYTKEELDKILENHVHWIKENVEGWQNMRADLRNADIRGANLWRANLRGADLRNANLGDADLRNADLWGANLRGADLGDADLRRANLGDADLRDADLRRANLRGADLRNANLGDADLRNADLWGANLRGADLGDADLRRANLGDADLRDADLRRANLGDADLRNADLWGANLRGADLRGAKNVPFIPMACPDTGAFVGWKKADGYVVKLFIPEDAKRSSATGRKCRCDRAVVLSIEERNGKVHDKPEKNFYARSDHDSNFIYRVGETVSVDNFCEERFAECAPGIHFFINKQEAIDYV